MILKKRAPGHLMQSFWKLEDLLHAKRTSKQQVIMPPCKLLVRGADELYAFWYLFVWWSFYLSSIFHSEKTHITCK